MPLSDQDAKIVEFCLKEEMTHTEIGNEIGQPATMIRSHLKTFGIPYHSTYGKRPDVLAGKPIARRLNREKYGLPPVTTSVPSILKDLKETAIDDKAPKNVTFMDNEGCRAETIVIDGDQRYCGCRTEPKKPYCEAHSKGHRVKTSKLNPKQYADL